MSFVSRTLPAIALAAAAVAAAATAAPAAAAPATITVANSRFTPSAVTVAPGESVTWDFTEPSHNVAGSGWSGNDGFGRGTFTRVFDAPGTFAFVCQAHPSSMKGSVTVTAAAPVLPAPGAGADALAGAGAAIGTLAGAVPGATWVFPTAPDRVAPRVAELRVASPAAGRAPVLDVSLSEDALLVVELRRGAARALRVRRRAVLGPNRIALAARGLRPGRYTVRIVAVDAAGNESPVRRATLRVRGPAS